ncbi:MAG: hypothetical protein ACJ75J_16160 [Cytophagaceae bacterium]
MKKFNHIVAGILLSLLAFTASSLRIKDEDGLRLIKSVSTLPVQKVSIDRYNFIYYADDRGNVYKYDQEGNLLLTFSPRKNSDVTLLEAWRNVNILVFYRNYQEFIFLNRFLTETPNFILDEEGQDQDKSVGFARLATFTGDNNLWIIDDDDFSLKKLDLTYNKLIIHTPLELVLDKKTYDFNFMREYQNLLFVNDKNSGILVFDNLGNYKSKLEFKGLNYFSFQGNSLYFIEDGHIRLYDIYTGEESKIKLPEGKQFQYALLGDKRAYLFTDKSMEVYQCPACKQ